MKTIYDYETVQNLRVAVKFYLEDMDISLVDTEICGGQFPV